jgi:hypothetical protein
MFPGYRRSGRCNRPRNMSQSAPKASGRWMLRRRCADVQLVQRISRGPEPRFGGGLCQSVSTNACPDQQTSVSSMRYDEQGSDRIKSGDKHTVRGSRISGPFSCWEGRWGDDLLVSRPGGKGQLCASALTAGGLKKPTLDTDGSARSSSDRQISVHAGTRQGHVLVTRTCENRNRLPCFITSGLSQAPGADDIADSQ